ncbi:holin family protein [Lysinibacillus sp. RSDA_15]|uniref:phage holin family protein n=1 Tax=Lysinibacillus TaxID=400634 RepID=UPI00068B8D99|nr:phage holin family protein [Lysinibacillus sphaericus]
MKTDTLYISFIGGIDHLIKALVIFMVLDYSLGFMVSLVFKKTESKKMFKGLIKKTAMVLMVIAAVQLDSATESGNFMRNAMILFLIGMEGISMIENLGKLGYPCSEVLSKCIHTITNG